MRILRSLVYKIKEYIKIQYIYPKRYPSSKIQSYINNEGILGDALIIKENVNLYSTIEKIGNYTYIGSNTIIDNCAEIGNYCSISQGVKIGMSNHALDHIGTSPLFYSKDRGVIEKDTFKTPDPCIIENDVLISANAVVLSGVKICTGSVIAAGAVVTKDVPPYAIVGGLPAKILRYRFAKEVMDDLLASKWWDKSIKELSKYKDSFNSVDDFIRNFNGT